MVTLLRRCGAGLRAGRCSGELQIRFSSSMFGSKFSGSGSDTRASERWRVLHLNASHSENSLVAFGARTLLNQLSFPHTVINVDLWQSNLLSYSVEHARAKLAILQGGGTQQDHQLFAPVLAAAELLNSVDLVIISTPMWNYSVPYTVKQYIDTVVQPGINFQGSFDHNNTC